MANITHFNVSDVALYYQALVALKGSPMASAIAAEEIRRRAVTYLERRRALFSLPSPRGQLDTLGEKILFDLRQMDLATIAGGTAELTSTGLAIADSLKRSEGRLARLAILGRLLESFGLAIRPWLVVFSRCILMSLASKMRLPFSAD